MAMSCLNTAWSGDFKIVWEKPSFSAALVRRMPSSVPGGKQASLDPIYLGLCFLSLRVTKFIKIPLPPGLLGHENRHHPSSPFSTSTEAISFVPPPGKNNFYKAICCNPVNFPLEQRRHTSTSSEGPWRTYPCRTRIPWCLEPRLQNLGLLLFPFCSGVITNMCARFSFPDLSLWIFLLDSFASEKWVQQPNTKRSKWLMGSCIISIVPCAAWGSLNVRGNSCQTMSKFAQTLLDLKTIPAFLSLVTIRIPHSVIVHDLFYRSNEINRKRDG